MTKEEAIFKCQHELWDKGPFFQTEMAQYAEQLAFEKGVEFTIEKACEYIYSHAHVTTFGDIRLEKCSINEFINDFRKAIEE